MELLEQLLINFSTVGPAAHMTEKELAWSKWIDNRVSTKLIDQRRWE